MGRKSAFQTRIEYIGMRGVFGALRVLPKKAAVGLSVGLAKTVFRILEGRMPSGMRSLEIAFPEMTVKERRLILNASIESIGRTIAETADFHPASADDSRSVIKFDFESSEFDIYKRAKADGRGVIMPTAHIGNWEILLSGFALQYEPIYFVARELDNPLIEEMFAKDRVRFGSRQFLKSDSAKGMLKALKAGESVGVLPDVNVHPNEGVFVPFFGVPASTTSGIARLAIQTNALIFPMFAIWDAHQSRYVVYHGQPIEPSNSGDREADVLETTAAYTLEIEKIIRRFPGQWLWIHKRWKTRPPGEPSLY